jgi:hypothetical protein
VANVLSGHPRGLDQRPVNLAWNAGSCHRPLRQLKLTLISADSPQLGIATVADPFKTSLNQAWQRASSALNLVDALPVVTALIEAETAYDRREAKFLEHSRREADRVDAVVPALRLLLAVVHLFDQPTGVDVDQFDAAVAAARAALADAQAIKTRAASNQQPADSLPSFGVANALFTVF